MQHTMQSNQAGRAIGRKRIGRLLCSLLLTPAMLHVGCGNGGEGSSGGIGGKTSGATGGAGSTGQGGISVTAMSSGGTGGSTAGKGGATGTGSDTSITALSGSQTLGSLSPMDATKLCNDTNAYFGKTLSLTDLCKWAGLTHGVSSIASSDAILQRSCKNQETSCLQVSSAEAKCDPIPESCSVTVSQHSACIADEAAAFNRAVSGMPSCSTVTLSDLAGVWEYGTAELPDSCARISEQCPSYNIPVPRPPSSDTGTDGSGGQSGSGSSTGSSGTGGTRADAGTGGSGAGGSGSSSTQPVGSGGTTGSGTSGGGATTAVIQGLPGDVAKAAGTPFVAAHAMTRALFSSYTGPLFKALRDSDKQEKDIGIVASTRLVDMTALDSFCSGTTCKVTTLYDQSGNGNDLWRGDVATNAPMDNGEAPKLCDLIAIEYLQLSDGSRLPIAVETGAMWKAKAQCLRNRDKTKNMPLNASPQTTYAIFHSKYLNNNCCFNYGNTGKRIHYTGPGTLSALNFSNIEFWSKGTGKGPWVMVDWEQGVYAGNIAKCGSGAAPSADCTATGENPNPPITFDVVTALAKHDGTKHWQIKAGNAKSGSLAVSIDLPTLPKGYSPLKQEGGLGLGEGGAGDPNGTGGFSEGAIVAAETTDAVDNAIQQSIVGVYGK